MVLLVINVLLLVTGTLETFQSRDNCTILQVRRLVGDAHGQNADFMFLEITA